MNKQKNQEKENTNVLGEERKIKAQITEASNEELRERKRSRLCFVSRKTKRSKRHGEAKVIYA